MINIVFEKQHKTSTGAVVVPFAFGYFGSVRCHVIEAGMKDFPGVVSGDVRRYSPADLTLIEVVR